MAPAIIPGAICNVEIEDGGARVRTIQNEPPSGICGTGAIETLYELLQAGLVDETGLLEEDYEEDGFKLAKGRDGEPVALSEGYPRASACQIHQSGPGWKRCFCVMK